MENEELVEVGGDRVRLPEVLEMQSLNDVTGLFALTIVEQLKKLKLDRKTSPADRTQILSRLVKAYSDLIKTHQSINHQDGRTTVKAGVIIVPGKSSNWQEEAKAELESAKAAIEGA